MISGLLLIKYFQPPGDMLMTGLNSRGKAILSHKMTIFTHQRFENL